MYARIAQRRRRCRTSLDPSRQRRLQYIHRTVPIILDRLDLDLSPAHGGSGGGSEGQVLTVVIGSLAERGSEERFKLGAADVSAKWETGPFSASG